MENKKERVFENTYIVVNIKSKNILSMKVTDDEHVHDSRMLSQLVEDVTKSKNMTIDKLFADGAYDDNEIFGCLSDKESCLVLK